MHGRGMYENITWIMGAKYNYYYYEFILSSYLAYIRCKDVA